MGHLLTLKDLKVGLGDMGGGRLIAVDLEAVLVVGIFGILDFFPLVLVGSGSSTSTSVTLVCDTDVSLI